MLRVESCGHTVAYINKQLRGADNYNAAEPWMLLHLRGRIDRFETLEEARAEAQKHFGTVKFRKEKP